LFLVAAAVIVAASATAVFAALSSGPTGGCLNPLAAHYSIQQLSMGPTLIKGDLVVVSSIQSGTPFARGQIVVFTPPAAFAGDSSPFIKRIIGLPGETVSIAGGRIVINGAPLDESYLAPGTETTSQGTETSWVIGADELFVLGDSRANSADSRSFGAIPVASVTGHAAAICAPDSRKVALP